MKLKLVYLIPFLAIFTSGCLSNSTDTPGPTKPFPEGAFAGPFRLIHKNFKTGHRDTLKANLSLTLSTAVGYKVTGDTATVHAGSYGDYVVGSNYIQFFDKTYSTAIKPTKTHLTGIYQYFYDGTSFQMLAQGALDTLSLQYDLKKVN